MNTPGDLQWLAVPLAALAVLAGVGTNSSRSQFGMCLSIAALGALAACLLTFYGRGEAALALAVVSCGWAPLLLLGVLTLSSPAPMRTRTPISWISLGAAFVVALIVVAAPLHFAPASRPSIESAVDAPAVLGVLIFVATIGAAGMLGYGERGAFQLRPRKPDE